MARGQDNRMRRGKWRAILASLNPSQLRSVVGSFNVAALMFSKSCGFRRR